MYLTDFHRTYINDALWESDKFWGQKSLQGRGGTNIMLKTALKERSQLVK